MEPVFRMQNSHVTRRFPANDGVDQDDIVGASGTHDFLAPGNIRSDQFLFRGTRLPYAKFPRDPGP